MLVFHHGLLSVPLSASDCGVWLVVVLCARDEGMSFLGKGEPRDAAGPDGRPLLHRPARRTEVVRQATLDQVGNACTGQLHDEPVLRAQHCEDLAVNPQSPRPEAVASIGHSGLRGERRYDPGELRHQGRRGARRGSYAFPSACLPLHRAAPPSWRPELRRRDRVVLRRPWLSLGHGAALRSEPKKSSAAGPTTAASEPITLKSTAASGSTYTRERSVYPGLRTVTSRPGWPSQETGVSAMSWPSVSSALSLAKRSRCCGSESPICRRPGVQTIARVRSPAVNP
jgi:hypothetical protein